MRKSGSQIYDELLVIKCRQGDKESFDEYVLRSVCFAGRLLLLLQGEPRAHLIAAKTF